MICNDVQKLIDYAIKKELITYDDIYVVRNQLMEALKLTDWESNNIQNTAMKLLMKFSLR